MSESHFFYMFVDHLGDIYSTEKQIVDALPFIIKGCVSTELKDAFRQHLEETKTQVKRLEQILLIRSITLRNCSLASVKSACC